MHSRYIIYSYESSCITLFKYFVSVIKYNRFQFESMEHIHDQPDRLLKIKVKMQETQYS